MRASRAVRISSAALFSCLVLAAGCTGSKDSPGTPETGDSPSVQTPSSTPETPAPTTPAATTSTADSTPLVDRLLPTGEVPGLNAQWHWQDGETRPAGTEQFGLCAKADLASIGAVSAVERTWFPPVDSDDNAAEQIAEFPDANTAARVWAVLKSWHDTCSRVASANPGLKVRPFVTVPVTTGSARWYLLSWNPAGEETGRFEAFGMVMNGTRIAVLRIDNSGQDYNYPAGKEPMAGMVRGAAGWLD
jgi:hypothetical protein